MTFYYYIAQGIKRGLGFRMLNYFRRVVILLKIYLRASPNVVLFRLLEKLRPHVATRIKKFYRRRVSLCAYVLYLQNSYNQACRFLYKAAVARKGVGIVLQLFLECVLCLQGRSAALQMRKETHAKAFEILRINRRFQKNKQPGTQIFQLPKSFWLSPTSNRWVRYNQRDPLILEHFVDSLDSSDSIDISDIRRYLMLRSLFIKRRIFRRYYWMLRHTIVGRNVNLRLQSKLFRKMCIWFRVALACTCLRSFKLKYVCNNAVVRFQKGIFRNNLAKYLLNKMLLKLLALRDIMASKLSAMTLPSKTRLLPGILTRNSWLANKEEMYRMSKRDSVRWSLYFSEQDIVNVKQQSKFRWRVRGKRYAKSWQVRKRVRLRSRYLKRFVYLVKKPVGYSYTPLVQKVWDWTLRKMRFKRFIKFVPKTRRVWSTSFVGRGVQLRYFQSNNVWNKQKRRKFGFNFVHRVPISMPRFSVSSKQKNRGQDDLVFKAWRHILCHWFIRQSDNSYKLERRYWSAFGFVNNLGAADPYNFINFFTGMGAGEFLMRMMAFRMKKSFGHVYRIFQTGSDREVRDAVNSVY